MRLFLFAILLSPLLLLSSCGCAGYGGDPYYPDPYYQSLLILKDSSDTIRGITYDIKPGEVKPNKQMYPVLISYFKPAYVHVKTDKKTYGFRVQVNANYYYWVDKKCDEGKATMTVSAPIIDSISGGILSSKRAYLNGYYGSPSTIVDSIFLAP